MFNLWKTYKTSTVRRFSRAKKITIEIEQNIYVPVFFQSHRKNKYINLLPVELGHQHRYVKSTKKNFENKKKPNNVLFYSIFLADPADSYFPFALGHNFANLDHRAYYD